MQRSINAWFFDPQPSPAEMARQCAQAGFEAIELTLAEEGAITPNTDEATCREIARQVRDAGLEIASLATIMFWYHAYGSDDPGLRRKAYDLTLSMLDRAAWLNAGAILVIPAVVGAWDSPVPQTAYADALCRSHDALHRLAPEAEQRSVVIAIENVDLFSRFLLSPVEMADLIDRVNSPWIGVYFDTANVMRTGYPQDWIRALGYRIRRLHIKDYDLTKHGMEGFCAPFDGNVDWQAVMKALAETGYDGPLTYEGKGDLADIKGRLDRIIAMQDS
ncbi:MAG: sugar phosphate isomerase/epimerase [Phycisphaerae bacterium]|nr:sugar phosphate isomerase/epimerase [Phycisphaerae bacterium]